MNLVYLNTSFFFNNPGLGPDVCVCVRVSLCGGEWGIVGVVPFIPNILKYILITMLFFNHINVVSGKLLHLFCIIIRSMIKYM